MSKALNRLFDIAIHGDMNGQRLLLSILAIVWGAYGALTPLLHNLPYSFHVRTIYECALCTFVGVAFVVHGLIILTRLSRTDNVPVREGFVGILLWTTSLAIQTVLASSLDSILLLILPILSSWSVFIRGLLGVIHTTDIKNFTIRNVLRGGYR